MAAKGRLLTVVKAVSVVGVMLTGAIAQETFAMQGSCTASFTASFTWAGIAPCEKISPSFTLKAVPQGTERLRFTMHDQQAPHFPHAGSTIAYAGDKVAEGAIAYIGPCPPAGETHHYVWTIEALDKTNKVLAKTTAAGDFPMR